MKIYTRTGDRGTTALFGGDRVRKDHPRIEAYGTVDETNAFLGLARSLLRDREATQRLDSALAIIQEDLFALGADLATPLESRAQVRRVSDDDIDRLEREIDRSAAERSDSPLPQRRRRN